MSILTMEAFSLLKLWRNVISDTSVGEGLFEADTTNSFAKTTCEVDNQAQVMDGETDEEESFFELVFTAPDCDGSEEKCPKNVVNSSKSDRELFESPKDSVLKGRIFPIEPYSKPQSPVSLLRSTPKFRIFMFGFGKSKLEKAEAEIAPLSTSPMKHQQQKCEVEEVRIASLLARDRSLRSKLRKKGFDEALLDHSSKRSPKDAVQKYMKLIKPLYVRVSKKYTEKLRSSDQASAVLPSSSPARFPRKQAEDRQGNRAAGLRVVCKHLGKSRSASSAARITQSVSSRRDDSLVQQHDGIQSAILHCKSSYNSRRDGSLLSRSTSDPWHEKSINPPRLSSEEEKRSSI